jgi:aspartyl-tRNA(Asn)/glutamyl-tRNA(Gln) amidotransferase subunit B
MTLDLRTEIEPVIGLEVHAQLLTQSKMFCSCSAAYLAAPPNSHTCPVCLGLPGSLPVINRKAVELTLRTALALNCDVAGFSKFDRKNYFYPDLPKGYQISQYDLPLSAGGHLDVQLNGGSVRVGITRVHLEEDTGKLIHQGTIDTSSSSLVDLNRAGVPLMEIVSEPDLRSAEAAREYMQRLRQILVWIGVNDGNLEEGSMRCDANVSVRPAGATELGTKVEVKNMNSFRAVHLALGYEIERQRAAMLAGAPIVQETRGWNEARGITVGQRSKEYAHDYRYFPEPDLPPLRPALDLVERVRAELPELPASRAARFREQLGLSAYDADQLTASRELADYFEAVLGGAPAGSEKEAGNWVIGEVNRAVNESGGTIADLKVRPAALSALIARKAAGAISNNQAKEVFAALAAGDEVAENAAAVDAVIAARGLAQVSDSSQLEAWVEEALAAEPQAAADFRAGNERAIGRLVGAVMRVSGGKANGPAVSELLRKKLGS